MGQGGSYTAALRSGLDVVKGAGPLIRRKGDPLARTSQGQNGASGRRVQQRFWLSMRSGTEVGCSTWRAPMVSFRWVWGVLVTAITF